MTKLLVTAALAMLPFSALAADLPARGPAPSPAPMMVTAPMWGGFYLGGQVGWMQATVEAGVEEVLPVTSFRGNGILGGLYAGHKWQFNNIILGVEVDGNVSGLSKTVSIVDLDVTAKGRSSYEVGLVGKAGFTFHRALFYVLGGASVTNLKSSISLGEDAFPLGDDTRVGWTIGAGAGYKFSQNWSARVEYRYSDYGKFNAAFEGLTVSNKLQTQRIMVGLGYHFGGSAAPVVARY